MLKVADCSLGVNKDAPPEELPPGQWTSARNVRFGQGFAEVPGGMHTLYTTAVIPYWLHFYRSNTANYLIHAGIAEVRAYNFSSQEDITGTTPTGAIDDRWTGGTLGGLLVMNNGVDQPMYWTGVAGVNLATLTNWNSNWRAESIRPFKQFLIAMNVTKSGTKYRHMVKWSDAAVPGALPAWDETDPASLADELDVSETTDSLIDGLPLGDQFILYKQRSMYRMVFTGAEQAFQVQRIPGDYGMMARGCAVITPLGHVVMTEGDVVLFDGQSIRSIANGTVKRWIFSVLDPDRFRRAFVTANPRKAEVLVCIPTRGKTACSLAAVWNWETGQWGLRDLPAVTYGAPGVMEDSGTRYTWLTMTPATWAEWRGRWVYEILNLSEARLALCHEGMKVSAYDYGSTDLGNTYKWDLERVGLGYDGSMKLFKDVFPTIIGNVGDVVWIQIGASLRPDQDPTWKTAVRYTIGSSHKVNAMVKGRSLAVRFYGETPGIKIRSYSIGVQPAGMF